MVYHPMWWMLLDCLDKKRSSCMEGSISRFHDAALVFRRVITCDRLLLQLKSKLDPKWNSAVYTSQNCKTSSKTQHLIKTSPNLTNVKINPEKYNTNTTIFLIFYSLLVPPPPPTFLLHLSTQMPPVFASPHHRKHLSPPPDPQDDANESTLEASQQPNSGSSKRYTPTFHSWSENFLPNFPW